MENRSFIPGSEWVYFKIYTGTKIADVILKNDLYGYVWEMMKKDVIDKWFFIRYSDPDFHIRLRLHLKETQNFTCIFNRFFEIFSPPVNSGLIWNVQCDTYQREMERYGANIISMIEDIFFIDSEYIIRFLQQLDNKTQEQQRWQLALVIVENYLSAFKLELPQRRYFSKKNAEMFKKEFGFVHHNATKQLNDKCRTYRKDIESVMLKKYEIFEFVDLIKAHMQAIIPLAEKIIIMEKCGELQVPMSSLLSSLIHMSLDRWFRTKNRLQEMLIFEFLSRFYTSEAVKNNLNF